MRSYQLYLIEDEFAAHYFGRERMFFQLFYEYEQSSGDLKQLLLKQIEFITKPISTLRLHQLLHQHLAKCKEFQTKQGVYYISFKKGKVRLEVSDRRLHLESDGDLDAETVFFEVLRKCEPSFLAVELRHRRFGWLKPMKERKFV